LGKYTLTSSVLQLICFVSSSYFFCPIAPLDFDLSEIIFFSPGFRNTSFRLILQMDHLNFSIFCLPFLPLTIREYNKQMYFFFFNLGSNHHSFDIYIFKIKRMKNRDHKVTFRTTEHWNSINLRFLIYLPEYARQNYLLPFICPYLDLK
jgi:hypothetical protein